MFTEISELLAKWSQNETIATGAHIVGFMGMICVVLAYLAIEKNWVDRSNPRFYWINLLGSVLLTLSLIIHFNLGSFLIEVFWFGISISGLMRIRREKQ